MALTTYSFSQIVSNIATAVQASASALLDYTVGSTLRAIAEATAAQMLWLQAIILQLLTVTRAATSVGSDLDSFGADYGFTRLAADAATGQVTFSRFTPSQQAQIPAGATIQTADGTQNFAVTVDTTNTAWNAGLNAYVLSINTASVSVPVIASAAGTGGNVQANTITVITTPLPGVDTVTNASPFINGIAAESDAAMRVRFVLYLSSLSKATRIAAGYAITSVQQGLSYTITENQDYNGTADMGYTTFIVDDGSGDPSSPLLTNVSNAIDAVRPLGSRFGVFAPTVVTANVTMVLTTAPSSTHAAVVAAVVAALQEFLNGLTLGTSLPYSQLAAVAYGVPGVTNATGILLNSGTADITATAQEKILAGAMVIS